MASSWYAQIPTILTLMRELRPRSVVDVGKGLGKYGLLLHEYYGINDQIAPDPMRTLAEQSQLTLDAVESERNFLWPHIAQLYRRVYVGRVEEIYRELWTYDVVLMIDVIEHIEKQTALRVLTHFIDSQSIVVVSSPVDFFQQENFGSPDEQHVSHWSRRDFRGLCHCQSERVSSSMIYVLSRRKLELKTFGRSPWRSLKRLAHAVRNEMTF
jgi:hypothetical protein